MIWKQTKKKNQKKIQATIRVILAEEVAGQNGWKARKQKSQKFEGKPEAVS